MNSIMNIAFDLLVTQLINLLIVFFVFKKFVGKPLAKAINNRRQLLKKLENADAQYEQIIQDANQEAQKLLKEGEEHKNKIIAEGGMIAEKRKEDILKDAHNKANNILDNATTQAEKIKQELEDNFAAGVKATTERVVKKLLNDKAELKAQYIDQAIADAK